MCLLTDHSFCSPQKYEHKIQAEALNLLAQDDTRGSRAINKSHKWSIAG